MSSDNLDTVAMEDNTQWAATQADDVFLPSVRVQLGWADVEAAVESGAIVPTQAHALWATWATPGGITRVTGGASLPDFVTSQPEKPWVPEQPSVRPTQRTGNGNGGGGFAPGILGLVMAFVLGVVVAYVTLKL